MNGVVDLHDAQFLTEFRERSIDQFTDVRDSGIPWNSDNALMQDELRERRLAAFNRAFEQLKKEGVIRSLNDWRVKAQVGYTTLSGFVSGDTLVMSDRTYLKLAEAVGRPVEWLKGDDVAQPESKAAKRLEAVQARLSEDQLEVVADWMERMFPQKDQ